MNERIALSKIPNGDLVRVKEVMSSVLKVRLMELGIVPDVQLRVLYRAPLGDPMAIEIGAYVLSLRNDEADLVLVEHETA